MIKNKTLMQCSIDEHSEDVMSQLMPRIAGWNYVHFNDESMIQYVLDNPLDEFPEIAQRILTYKRGAHKVDLFRYYYLYINGGVFIDSDMMIYEDLDNILKQYDFVSIFADKLTPYAIFNGFLGCNANDKIIYEALKNAYAFNPSLDELDIETNAICKKLYTIVKESDFGNIKLYRESIIHWAEVPFSITSDNDKVIAAHYFVSKEIPNELPFEKRTNLDEIAELLSINFIPDAKYVRFGSFFDGGYPLIDDIKSSDFCVSFGVERNIDFEEDFLKIGMGVHSYDNSIDSPPEMLNNMEFYKETIGEETYLSDVLSRITVDSDLILKMDIEGGEYGLVNNASSDELNRFRQIIVEVHWLSAMIENEAGVETLKLFLEKMNKTHVLVLSHPNNNSSSKIIDNYFVPDVLELLYVRKSDYNFVNLKDQFKGIVRRCSPLSKEIGTLTHNHG